MANRLRAEIVSRPRRSTLITRSHSHAQLRNSTCMSAAIIQRISKGHALDEDGIDPRGVIDHDDQRARFGRLRDVLRPHHPDAVHQPRIRPARTGSRSPK